MRTLLALLSTLALTTIAGAVTPGLSSIDTGHTIASPESSPALEITCDQFVSLSLDADDAAWPPRTL